MEYRKALFSDMGSIQYFYPLSKRASYPVLFYKHTPIIFLRQDRNSNQLVTSV